VETMSHANDVLGARPFCRHKADHIQPSPTQAAKPATAGASFAPLPSLRPTRHVQMNEIGSLQSVKLGPISARASIKVRGCGCETLQSHPSGSLLREGTSNSSRD